METKCFVNGCSEPVTLLWTLNTNLTYSCKSHTVTDEHSLLKREDFHPSSQSSLPSLPKLILTLAFLLVLIILFTFSQYLFSQTQFLINIVNDIEELKHQSDLSYKFYSELTSVTNLLKTHEVSFAHEKTEKVLQENDAVSPSKHYKKSKREVLMTMADEQIKLSTKVEMLVKNLGILYQEQESEILSIVSVGGEVLYGTMAGSICSFSTQNHKHRIELQGTSRVYQIILSKDLVTALVTGDTVVNFMSVPSKKYLKSFIAHSRWILAATFSDDNKYFVTGSCDMSIKVWDHSTNKELFMLNGHTGDIWALALSSSNKYLVSSGEDKQILVWDFETHLVLRSLTVHTAPVYSLKITKDEKTVFSASGDGTIRVWDLKTGSLLNTLEHKGMIRSILLIKNEKFLLSVSGRSLKIWDLSTMVTVAQMKHTENLISLAVSEDEKFVFTGDVFSRVWVWEIETNELKTVFGGAKKSVKKIEISHDLQMMAIAEEGLVRVWDLSKMVQVEVMRFKGEAEKWREVFRVGKFMEFLE